jgi:hypothetical protein
MSKPERTEEGATAVVLTLPNGAEFESRTMKQYRENDVMALEPFRSVICKQCGETMTTWSATTPRLSSGANFSLRRTGMTTHSIGRLIECSNRLQTHRGVDHAAVS